MKKIKNQLKLKKKKVKNQLNLKKKKKFLKMILILRNTMKLTKKIYEKLE